jgi:hypothetical protein
LMRVVATVALTATAEVFKKSLREGFALSFEFVIGLLLNPVLNQGSAW